MSKFAGNCQRPKLRQAVHRMRRPITSHDIAAVWSATRLFSDSHGQPEKTAKIENIFWPSPPIPDVSAHRGFLADTF